MDRRYTTTDIEALTEDLGRFFKSARFTLIPIEGGASSRIYFRIDFREESYFPGDSVMLMVVPQPEMRMLTDYMHIDYYLRRMQVPTPRLYELNQNSGWIFLKCESAPTLENYLLQHRSTPKRRWWRSAASCAPCSRDAAGRIIVRHSSGVSIMKNTNPNSPSS